MEHEGLLPQSQVPATCPYHEPDLSSQCPIFYFLKIHLNIFLSFMSRSSKWTLSLPLYYNNHNSEDVYKNRRLE
jgi:hypothetical protein